MTVNCEEYRKALVGNTQKNKFSKLIEGLESNQGQRSLRPHTLGLCDPSSNPEAMALLTQPQRACKQAAERGTSMPPEMESEVWEEYKRLNEWSVGERFEPLTEKWYVSPAIYAPGSPFISTKNNPMGKTKYAKAFQVHLHLLCGINGSCRMTFFSEQCHAVMGWAIICHNLMLDICMFCEKGEELKALLGSVDDSHGDIFSIFYKFMECCRIRVPGFGLWIKDNPAEWLVKDQAFLLQGPPVPL